VNEPVARTYALREYLKRHHVTGKQITRHAAKIGSTNAVRRNCEAAFFLAEYDLLHRRCDEAASLMQEAAKSCSFDSLERNAVVGEAKRLRP
jgi:hypothetical protein